METGSRLQAETSVGGASGDEKAGDGWADILVGEVPSYAGEKRDGESNDMRPKPSNAVVEILGSFTLTGAGEKAVSALRFPIPSYALTALGI